MKLHILVPQRIYLGLCFFLSIPFCFGGESLTILADADSSGHTRKMYLSGQVRLGSTGEPLSFAKVESIEDGLEVECDYNGVYRIELIDFYNRKRWKFKCSYIGLIDVHFDVKRKEREEDFDIIMEEAMLIDYGNPSKKIGWRIRRFFGKRKR